MSARGKCLVVFLSFKRLITVIFHSATFRQLYYFILTLQFHLFLLVLELERTFHLFNYRIFNLKRSSHTILGKVNVQLYLYVHSTVVIIITLFFYFSFLYDQNRYTVYLTLFYRLPCYKLTLRTQLTYKHKFNEKYTKHCVYS